MREIASGTSSRNTWKPTVSKPSLAVIAASREEIATLIIFKTESEHKAFEFEKALIAKYGSKVLGTGTLLNIAELDSIPDTPETQNSPAKTNKNYKSSWHLARSGGTKQEVEDLKLEELRRVAAEIEANPMWITDEEGKWKYNL